MQPASQGQNGSMRDPLPDQPGTGALYSRPGHLSLLTLPSVGILTHIAELSHFMRQNSEFLLSILHQRPPRCTRSSSNLHGSKSAPTSVPGKVAEDREFLSLCRTDISHLKKGSKSDTLRQIFLVANVSFVLQQKIEISFSRKVLSTQIPPKISLQQRKLFRTKISDNRLGGKKKNLQKSKP